MLISAGLSPLTAIYVALVFVDNISPGLCDWPEGTYGIPAHKDGCPRSDHLYRWKLGSVLQKTELGSHTSGSVSLLGMPDGLSDTISQTFCMKTSYRSSDKHRFMPGKYCILKLNNCPERFQEGWIYWDDAGPWIGPTIQNSSGVLPDGDYGRNTRIEYCCRFDGETSDEIVLPTSDPFYLLKYADLCQEVVGMDVAEQWVYWSGEKSLNFDENKGVHPKVERQKYPFTYTKLFYCYYTPKKRAALDLTQGSWLESFLMVLCIIGATLGIIFLFAIILTIIQRALIARKQRCRHLQQNRHPQTNVRNDRLPEHQMIVRSSAKPTCGSSLPEYSSCIASSKTQNVCPKTKRDSYKKDEPMQAASVLHDCSSVDSVSIQPDAESEAPPSYDEVLRDGNLNFIK